MSINDAIQLIMSDLPPEAAAKVAEVARADAAEHAGPGFSFWKNRRPADTRRIIERRLAMAKEAELRSWLEGQLRLLEELEERGEDSFYQGYIIDGRERLEFAIAPTLGRSVTYRSAMR